MRKAVTLLVSAVLSIGLYASNSSFPVIYDITKVGEGADEQSVVNMPRDGVNDYYLFVGPMGIGNDVISVQVDPVNHLFVPLGNTLVDALARLEEIKALFDNPVGTVTQMDAGFGPLVPDANPKTLRVTRQRVIFTNQLQFALDFPEYVRTAYLTRSDLNSLISGVKFYSKLHPKD